MEYTVAYILGTSVLGVSAAITVYMVLYPVWCMIKGEGLSGPAVSIAGTGIGIEGANVVPAGDPAVPANANEKPKRARKEIAA